MRFGSLLLCLALLAGLLAVGCHRKDPVDRLIEKGDQFFTAGDFEGANDHYRAVLLRVTDEPRALARMGRIAYREGRVLTAYILLQNTVSKIPPDPEMDLIFGLASFSLGKTAEGRAAAKKMLAVDPTNE